MDVAGAPEPVFCSCPGPRAASHPSGRLPQAEAVPQNLSFLYSARSALLLREPSWPHDPYLPGLIFFVALPLPDPQGILGIICLLAP